MEPPNIAKGDSYALSKYKGILNELSILAPETNCWNKIM